MLISWVDLNLVIARESVPKGESLMVGAVVDNLIDERRWKVVFWTCVIEIVKYVCHRTLEGCTGVFEAEGNDTI